MADETKETTQAEAPQGAASVSADPPEALRLALPDGPAAKPGRPFEKGQGKAIVRVRWPHDSFEHGLKGVPVITAHGVEVDRAKAEALNEAAAKAGTELEEIG